MGFSESEIVKYAESKSILVDRDAISLLAEQDSYTELIDEFVGEGEFLIAVDKLKDKLLKHRTKLGSVEEVVVRGKGFKALAKEVDGDFRIMKEYDVTDQSCSEGTVQNFLAYFRDKFEVLSEILRRRQNFSPRDIMRIKEMGDNTDVHLIGMVMKKWKSKNGNEIVQVEDLEDSCIVVVSQNNLKLVEDAARVLMDDVIGVKGRKIAGGMIIANEILWPDLENRPLREAKRNLSVALTSDFHLGSKLFLEAEFDKFLDWINGKVESEKEAEAVGRIKYLVIAGDNVDGIGVYPNQHDELAIKDIYEQYDEFCKRILQIPEYIDIFICPGQHDAVRRADPQPAIPKEYVKDIANLKNVHLVGSPGWFEIEGLKSMIYHGAAMHDMYTSLNFLDPTKPQLAIVEALKHRDLMVGYGIRQPYVPEKKDFMVVREEPDLYFGGDMHHNGYEMYRSCLVLNSGTWQGQTEFQLEQGHVPTPGIVPIVNLKTREISERKFSAEGMK